ncbi:hypothetical protein [Streptomyces sp.]
MAVASVAALFLVLPLAAATAGPAGGVDGGKGVPHVREPREGQGASRGTG